MQRMSNFQRKSVATFFATAVAVAISSCGAQVSTSSSAAAPAQSSCGTINVADNPWVGYEADMGVFE